MLSALTFCSAILFGGLLSSFKWTRDKKTNYPINIWTNQNNTFNKGNDPIKIWTAQNITLFSAQLLYFKDLFKTRHLNVFNSKCWCLTPFFSISQSFSLFFYLSLSLFFRVSPYHSVSVPLFLTLYVVLFLLVLLLGLSDFRCGSLHVATLSGILGIST